MSWVQPPEGASAKGLGRNHRKAEHSWILLCFVKRDGFSPTPVRQITPSHPSKARTACNVFRIRPIIEDAWAKRRPPSRGGPNIDSGTTSYLIFVGSIVTTPSSPLATRRRPAPVLNQTKSNRPEGRPAKSGTIPTTEEFFKTRISLVVAEKAAV